MATLKKFLSRELRAVQLTQAEALKVQLLGGPPYYWLVLVDHVGQANETVVQSLGPLTKPELDALCAAWPSSTGPVPASPVPAAKPTKKP